MSDLTQQAVDEAGYVCQNCGGPVRQRRPSLSGRHYCSEYNCVLAKNRERARERAAKAREDRLALKKEGLFPLEERVKLYQEMLIARQSAEERVHCFGCGADDVVSGWPHLVHDEDANVVQVCLVEGNAIYGPAEMRRRAQALQVPLSIRVLWPEIAAKTNDETRFFRGF